MAIACGGGPNVISEGRAGSYESALAVVDAAASARLVAGWYDTRDGNGEIYIRALDPSGHPAAAEHRLTTNAEESYEVSLDGDGAALAVAWYDKSRDGTLSGSVGRAALDSGQSWFRSLGRGTRNPVVRARGGRIFCAWIAAADAGESVWGAWWDRHGNTLGAPSRLGAAGRTTWNLNAAIDEGGTARVVWDAVAGTRSDELFMGTMHGSSATLERISDDDGVSSKYPDIAIEGDRMALTWFDTVQGNSDVYLKAGGTVRRVTRTAGESIGAYLAWNAGRIGLAWSDNTIGQHEVYFQTFSAAAVALAEPRRITWSSASSLIPAIRPWRDGFALAWNEYTAPMDGAHGGHGGRSVIATAVVR
jgi:hypothetical protein